MTKKTPVKKREWIMEGNLLCLAPSRMAKPIGVTATKEGGMSGLAQAVIYGQAIINSSIN